MTFMEETVQSALPIWDRCLETDFMRAMAAGTLDRARFREYIVQDSLYLRGYLKAYAIAICKSPTLRDMQEFASALKFVNDGENATRLGYLADFGMTDDDVERVPAREENKAYTDYCLRIARENGIPEILMAVLPCMLGYCYVFERLQKNAPGVADSYFGALAADYTSAGYKKSCGEWTSYANERCGRLEPDKKRQLTEIFLQSSRHELFFWEMAGKDPTR